MGHVEKQTRNEGYGFAEWSYLCLNEHRTVSWLIRNRSRLDGAFYANQTGIMNASELPAVFEPVFCTYMDLDRLLEISGLTMKQREIIDALMEGYSLTDVAKMRGCTKQAISAQLIRSIKKINAENLKNWKLIYGKKSFSQGV